jgi:hypothetical protein
MRGQAYKIQIMKKIVLAVLALSICTLFACKKNKDGKSEYPFVYLNDCISKMYSHDNIRLCFNEIISDSRCPKGMYCIWEGAVVGKFTFSSNNKSHVLTLATNPLNLPVSKDTVVDGYRIEFIDLKPDREQGTIPPPSQVRAEVKITRL